MRNSIIRKRLTFAIILLFIGASTVSGFNKNSFNISQPVNRGWLYVGGNGPGNYSTIQSAINAANPDDTIYVYKDIYYENVLIEKDDIRLLGEDKYDTIIDGSTGFGNGIFIHNCDFVNVSNFTIRNSQPSAGGPSPQGNGVYILSYSMDERGETSNNNTLFDCIICNNSNIGVYLHAYDTNAFANNNLIRDCEISNNGLSGIYFDVGGWEGGGSYLINNKILSSEISNNGNSQEPTPWDCRTGITLKVKGIITQTLISNCNLFGNHDCGICITGTTEGQTGGDNNSIIHNNLYNMTNNAYDEFNNSWYDEFLQEGNYWIDYIGEDNNGDGIGDTAYNIPGGTNQDLYPFMYPNGWILHSYVWVDDDFNSSTPGWGYDHFNKIQYGIDRVANNGTIYVFNGSYQEQINVTKSVVIQGENNTGTIVVGGFNVTADYTTIQNFNITQGFEWISEENNPMIIYKTGIYSISSNNIFCYNNIWNISGQNATGIYIQNSTSNNISNNQITNIHGGDTIISCWYEEYFLFHNGGFSVGIYQHFSSNNIISNNILSDIKGGDGESFSIYAHAGTGGNSTGIYLNSSNHNFIYNNQITEINGGTAGDILIDVPGRSGNGGFCKGIVFDNSSYNMIYYNDINNINGGRGGNTGEDAVGGTGGETFAINVISSMKNNITMNHIFNITSGAGGSADVDGTAGDCGGIVLKASNLIFIINNTITGITGSGGRKGGDSYGVYLKESNIFSINNNSISKIIGGNSNWYTFSGGIASGIFVTSSNSIDINMNIIYELNSGNGGSARWFSDGANGGDAIGVFFSLSNSSSCTNNVISGITGGDGGIGEWGCVAGTGGKTSGISTFSSELIQVSSNIISQIFGGLGGLGGGNAGSGGCAYGIDFVLTNFSLLKNNTISSIVGNIGGGGFAGGPGGDGIGIGVQFSVLNNISLNDLESITAGSGGSGSVLGGNGGIASGIFLGSSMLNDVCQNTILDLIAGTGGNILYDDNEGITGNGGISAGTYLIISSFNNISYNQISNTTGGNGGSAPNAPGGDGGIGLGINLYKSNTSNINHNQISNNRGGNGGTGVGNINGSNGIGVGIFMNNTVNNLCYDNYVSNNTENAIDNGNNKWNITKTLGTNIIGGPYLGGNFWDDYTGEDLNGDGLGDTDIPYGPGDYLPVVEYVNLPPNANFTFTIEDKTVSFNATLSYDINGFITDYYWDFGDGTNGTGVVVNHTYYDYLTYPVSLTVIDNEGDSNTTSLYIDVEDFISPEILDNTPSVGYTGDSFTFNATIIENNMLWVAFVYFWYDNGDTMVAQLSNTNGDNWEASIIIEDTLESLNYYFAASDISGNFNSTEPKNISIIDNDDPEFIDNSSISGTTGDDYTFDIAASDNIGIDDVTVSWIHGIYWEENVSLDNDGDGTWSRTIRLDHDLSPMFYIITVTDISGNMIIGSTKSISVYDNDSPMLEDNSSSTGYAGDYFIFDATVSDNIDISTVSVEYWFDEGTHNSVTLENVGGDSYEGSTSNPIPLTALTLHYIMSAEDTSGNTVHTDTISVSIIPDNPPEAPLINGPTTGKPGTTYTYTFVAEDPNDDDVFYEINWGDGQVDNWYGPCESNIVISRTHSWDEKGTYMIQARAKDIYGAIGDWGSLTVTMPLDQIIGYQSSQQIMSFLLKKIMS